MGEHELEGSVYSFLEGMEDTRVYSEICALVVVLFYEYA